MGFNSVFKQISIIPEPSIQLDTIQNKVIEVLIDWNNFAHSPVSFEFPKAEVALVRSNWTTDEFEKAKSNAQQLRLEENWTI